MTDAAKPAVKVRYYRFRNKLREKTAGLVGAGTAGGGAAAEVYEIDEQALARAEQLFAEMAEDYPDWVQAQLDRLYALHRRAVDHPDQRGAVLKELFAIAHDLKGQGGTFGYPLVTAFATSLNRFTVGRTVVTDSNVEIIKAHIDAMRAVIRDRVSGDGGDIGKALARGLEAVIAKFNG